MESIPADVLGPRDIVVAEGPDAATYLQSQLAQDISSLAVGAAAWTFVLDPGGKVVALARVSHTADDRFELDTDAGFGDVLLARLARFKIRVQAELTLEPGDPGAAPRDEGRRVALGWPAMGHEIVPGETVPAATGLAGVAVSFTKGCYPGQELVERMDSRGAAAPRTLRRLVVPAGAMVGDDVLDSGEVVGVLTSVAGTNGLAYVQRGRDVGEAVRFDG